jgi:hypothetical protein
MVAFSVRFRDKRTAARAQEIEAMQSTSMSKCPGQAGTQAKMRASGSFGK